MILVWKKTRIGMHHHYQFCLNGRFDLAAANGKMHHLYSPHCRFYNSVQMAEAFLMCVLSTECIMLTLLVMMIGRRLLPKQCC